MQPERVRIALRERRGFEAVDLGIAMARTSAGPLARTWLLLVVPLAAGAIALLWRHPFWTVLLLWWLRPVFGRVPLHVLSRAVFGERSGVVDVLRHLPGLLRGGLLASLTTLRLSPARTLLLPVLQLEGLRGRARRERCRLLMRQDLSTAAGLLAAGAHFHAMLVTGLLLFASMLLPEELGGDVFAVFDPFLVNREDDPRQVVVPALYLLGIGVVEPLLVAGGFALYLNRRVQLEAWDIELAFRDLARRAAPRPPGVRRVAAALALALGLAGAAPALRAEPCAGGGFEAAKSCAEAVVAAPEFGSTREVTRWTLRKGDGDDDDSAPWLPAWFGDLFAGALEVGMWAGLAALVVALFVALSRHMGEAPRERPPPGLPPLLFGLDLDPRSLPEDLLGAARQAFARGDGVGALSLLYRGALVRVAEGSDLAVPESATELECLALVRRAAPGERAEVFDALTALWLRARYGADLPTPERFGALCAGFGAAFPAPAPGARG